jgi:hypothetical protein
LKYAKNLDYIAWVSLGQERLGRKFKILLKLEEFRSQDQWGLNKVKQVLRWHLPCISLGLKDFSYGLMIKG